jgi:hypothetical protein
MRVIIRKPGMMTETELIKQKDIFMEYAKKLSDDDFDVIEKYLSLDKKFKMDIWFGRQEKNGGYNVRTYVQSYYLRPEFKSYYDFILSAEKYPLFIEGNLSICGSSESKELLKTCVITEGINSNRVFCITGDAEITEIFQKHINKVTKYIKRLYGKMGLISFSNFIECYYNYRRVKKEYMNLEEFGELLLTLRVSC